MASKICKLCLFKCETEDETTSEWLSDVDKLVGIVNDLFHQMVTFLSKVRKQLLF